MDIQREREAFEAWHYEQYLFENPNIDISNAKYIYDYAHKNALVCQLKESHFTVWQAAKSKDVPEGCIIVPLRDLRIVMELAEDQCDEYIRTNECPEVHKAIHDVKAMIKAQDTASTSDCTDEP